MIDDDAFELVLLASANAVTSFTVYITFTFSYLAAAYLAGRKLTGTQTAIVSSLYVFSSLSCVLNMLSDIDYYEAALSGAPELLARSWTHSPAFWKAYMPTLLAAGVVASLYFMWSIRRDASER